MPVRISLFRRSRRLRAVFLLSLLPFGVSFAEDKQPNTLGEKTAETFGKLQTIVREAKPDWDAALALMNSLIPQLAPDSYDLAQALQTKGKLLLQKEEYAKAIEPLETALRLSDTKQYLDPQETAMVVDLLARLYAQEAVASKSPKTQHQYFAKAIAYFKRVLQDPKVTSDSLLTYAQILVQAATVDADKPDMALIKEARGAVDNVLRTTIKPKESAYLLLQFILQTEGDIAKSGEILELLVSQYPNKANYWQQLMATYNTLAGSYSEKDPEKTRQYYIRAINTIERAQPYGFMKGPKDQHNLVTIYSIAGQFGRSTELLYAGLKNGTIESTVQNWFLLAYAYQQVHQELQAIAALKEAAKIFPKEGQVDFMIGQIYYGLEDIKNANAHFRTAVTKGNLEKQYPTLMILAYTSFELGNLDEALEVIKKAEKLPEGPKDTQLTKMKEAIESAIKEREEKKAEAEARAAATKATL
jgi:tetratricopeptide (TPR) repeat protein